MASELRTSDDCPFFCWIQHFDGTTSPECMMLRGTFNRGYGEFGVLCPAAHGEGLCDVTREDAERLVLHAQALLADVGR